MRAIPASSASSVDFEKKFGGQISIGMPKGWFASVQLARLFFHWMYLKQ